MINKKKTFCMNITKIIGTISVMFFCMLFLFTACKKELKAPAAQPLQTGELTASKDTIIINAAAPGDEAVTFTWSAAANSLIENRLVMTANGITDTTLAGKNITSKQFTNAELNSILVEKLSLTPDVEAEVQVTLEAAVTINNNKASSNTVTLKVTPAPTGAAYSALWIVGDATPNGWNIDAPSMMEPDPTNAFQFKYNEVLNAGEFKIPVSTGNWGTDFYMPPTNHPDITSTDVELIRGGNPDNKWQITTAGAYKILLNISNNPFVHITPFTPSATLYMVGDATSAGWNIEAPVAMTPTPGNVYEFTYTGALNAGEFKIPVTTGNWGTDYYMPVVNDEGITSKNAIFVPGGNPDNKWKITEAGDYKITINQLKETISIEKQ